MPTLTIVPDDVVRRFVFVPEGHDQRLPENPYEVLRRAHDVLADEARWMQGVEHVGLNGNDDPYCGNWRACAIGAVGLVSVGVTDANATNPENGWCAWGYGLNVYEPEKNEDEQDQKLALLYRRSVALLDEIAGIKYGRTVVAVNDKDSRWVDKDETREQVLVIFKGAYKVAKLFDYEPEQWYRLPS